MIVSFLVLVEVAVLFSGIVARYVFHSPLIWSDELASVLFLWLAMLGSVVALRQGGHMRMTTFVNKASPETKLFLETIAITSAVAFMALILQPSLHFAIDEVDMSMPGLDISAGWRAAAMPVGIALMAIVAVLKLLLSAAHRVTLISIAVIVGIALPIYIARPFLLELGNINLVIFFVGMISACVFAGLPIAFAFGLATFSYLGASTETPMIVVIGRMGEGMSHLILLSVPMFVFLGVLIEATGMAKRLIAFLASLLGHVRGGLSYVLIGAMYLISGISGSKAADMAAIAPALFPEMRRRGSDPGELVALLSATGAQTETIPPSLVLITVGSVTGVSISALFTGGLMPAVIVGAMLCGVVWWKSRGESMEHVPKMKVDQVVKSFLVAFPALALPFVIRTAVVEGVATATEVSTIGIVYSFIVGIFIYREFKWKRLKPMLIETASLSGAILLIIGCATSMAWALTQSGFSNTLAESVSALPGGKFTFIAVSIIGFIILGSVLEGIPAMVLFAPLMFPIAQAVGVNEVHYAMITILDLLPINWTP
ncbi:TRAP transporter large permease subunit [Polynucleobacter sp. 31A-FELB]|uniref:TRAP transporter large permease n=1 Tax=Polynucleobacter sp. 31A-FELB TaxID=2689096 RepID=UPI00351D78F2